MKTFQNRENNSIWLSGDGRMMVHADYPEKAKDQIILFRISPKPDGKSFPEKEFYFAVPNGKSVLLKNVPFRDFELEAL